MLVLNLKNIPNLLSTAERTVELQPHRKHNSKGLFAGESHKLRVVN
jgi:hypothetical protein